ncbi:MAG: hypothetical protein ACTSWX_02765 [Promethearchaeota archaeon]
MTSRRTFSLQELQVLISLQEKPNATLEEIANATHFSTSLVFKIIKRLTDTKNFKKPAFSITAHPNLFAMGLEIIDVIVSCKDLSQIKQLEKLSINHPYTVYRAKCFGYLNGIFFQFRIPIGTKSYIDDLFSQLKERNHIENYRLLEFGSKNVIYTSVKLESWNIENLSWNFDWKKWFEIPLDIAIDSKNAITTNNQDKNTGYVKKWLKKRDVAILNELAVDARRKNKEIMEILQKKNNIHFSPQSFSRRFSKIKEECVDRFRVFIDPNAFQLITPVLILGNGDTKKINNLAHRLKKYPIPFNSVLKIKNSELFWYLHIPSIFLTYILNYLQGILTEMQFFYIDVGTVQTWGLWSDTFDDSSRNWIQTREFMVDDVLKES